MMSRLGTTSFISISLYIYDMGSEFLRLVKIV